MYDKLYYEDKKDKLYNKYIDKMDKAIKGVLEVMNVFIADKTEFIDGMNKIVESENSGTPVKTKKNGTNKTSPR